MTTTIGLRKLEALLMNSLKQYHPDLKDRPTETSNLYPPYTKGLLRSPALAAGHTEPEASTEEAGH